VSEFFFPDTTVLCNFAAIEQLDLLRALLRERGRWTEAVAFETERSARHLPALASIAEQGWLGEPIEITDPQQMLRLERTRRASLGGTPLLALKHLGEAQTCLVIADWKEYDGSWWISDDREALEHGRIRHITTRETIDLMAMAVADGDLSSDKAYDLMHQMAGQGRHLRLPDSPRVFT
jgi:predicted nucleic acid-binding protein